MKVITLLNEKGGVGKTTLATHIAAGLAIRGHRVVLIDADPQGHATITVGHQKAPGLYDLLVRDAPWQETLKFISPETYECPGIPTTGQLFLIPSNVETRTISMSTQDPFVVETRLEEINQTVDFCIIDTSPTPSLLHGSLYLATDAILYPVAMEYLSIDGLKESMSHREKANQKRREHNIKPIHTLGIVPTMFRRKTLEHQEYLGELQKAFGSLVWTPLPLRTIWTEASRLHRPVWSLQVGDAAAEAWALIDHFRQEVVRV